jgi:hypothetical protein
MISERSLSRWLVWGECSGSRAEAACFGGGRCKEVTLALGWTVVNDRGWMGSHYCQGP